MEELKEKMRLLSSILRSIKNGRLKIRFKGFVFGAYHVEDQHVFETIKDEKVVGKIALMDLTYSEENNDDLWFKMEGLPDEVWMFDYGLVLPNGKAKVMAQAKDIICHALLRDDKEYCSLMSDGKTLYLPEFREDLSREEVLKVKSMDFSIHSLPLAKL